jgi:hypothetical protein
MSFVSRALPWAKFLAAIWPDLREFSKVLFSHTKGDPEAARALLKKMPDAWEGYAAEVARVNKELADLKAQGR